MADNAVWSTVRIVLTMPVNASPSSLASCLMHGLSWIGPTVHCTSGFQSYARCLGGGVSGVHA